MMNRITKASAISSLRPGAEFVMTGGELTWMSPEIPQPTDSEINAEISRLQAEQPKKEAEANRQAAYIAESDPLFFKAQRGEATMQEWEAKVAEIKARYPKE